jgi:ligand-binding sensor domain-containing protein/two-component sensor histidine kinase
MRIFQKSIFYPLSLLLWILLWAFLLSPHFYFAQTLQTKKITEENGLSDNSINCIFKDHNQYVWVGTSFGLNKIDGSSITTYTHNPNDANSMNNNVIKCIAEDKNGTLWVGTENGLEIYQRNTNSFLHIKLKNVVPSVTITDIAIGTSGMVYMASNLGLLVYNPNLKSTQRLIVQESPSNYQNTIANNTINKIVYFKNNIYFCTPNGLWCYNEKNHQFHHEIKTKTLFITFLIDSKAQFWIGTWGGGLLKWDKKTNTTKHFDFPDKTSNVLSLVEIENGKKTYIKTPNFCVYTNRYFGDSLVFVSTNPQSKTYLFDSTEKLLWEGSNQGIVITSTLDQLFHHLNFPSNITNQGVSILKYKDKFLLGGANKDFLKVYDFKLHCVKNLSSLIPFQNVECLSLNWRDENTVRCGTSQGIVDINLSNNKVHFFHLDEKNIEQYQLNFITATLKDKQKNWWFFPWRNGVWQKKANAKKIEQLFSHFVMKFETPKKSVITDACQDQWGNIWMADIDEGILLYSANTHKFSKPFSQQLGDFYSCSQVIFKDGFCYSFLPNELIVWKITQAGTFDLQRIPIQGKTINSLAIDELGNCWLATQNGLLAFTRKDAQIHHFSIANGLYSNKLMGVLRSMGADTMLFASANYMFIFSPKTLLKRTQLSPDIQLSSVLVNGEISPFSLLKNNYFDYSQSNFVFNWSVTDYTDPLNNHYYYKLENIDKTWKSAGKIGKIEYPHLSAGHYTLLLKGENVNGVASKQILRLRFTVLLPFWKTNWFMFLLFFCVLALFYIIYRYRLNQLEKFNRLRNKIALDLHDEIGSTLSSISILSEMSYQNTTDAQTATMLEEIKNNSISIMEKMDDIVWSINPMNDNLEQLFMRVKAFAAKLFEAKNINYTIEVSENIHAVLLNMEKRQHVYLIVKEAINNMVKHAQCSVSKIKVNVENGNLKINISDNGIGYDVVQKSNGNGLLSMHSRAKALKANLTIVSTPHQGTSITLIVKIK